MIESIYTVLLTQALNTTPIQDQGLMHSKSSKRYELKRVQMQEETPIKPFAKLRTAYIYRDDKLGDVPSNYATAVGGYLGIDTASYQNFNLHVAAYISEDIDFLTGEGSYQNREFLDNNGQGYAYIGEASLVYKTQGFEAMLGRIKIDTPYAGSDDIRMSFNTFEGAWAYVDIFENTSLQSYYLHRMAGIDSDGNQNEFDPLYDEDAFGLTGIALDYHYEENEIALWYYYVDKMAQLLYLESHYSLDIDRNWHMDFGVQGSSLNELDDSGVEGDVVGLSGMLHYRQLFMGGAYNYGFVSESKQLSDGFGGGPYFTSLDEATLAAASSLAVGEDVKAYRLGLGYEEILGQDLVLELIHGHLVSEDKTVDIEENDIIITYQITQNLYFEGVGAKFHQYKSANKFERLVLRLDYSF